MNSIKLLILALTLCLSSASLSRAGQEQGNPSLWVWKANIKSKPSGAKVYCVSNPNNKIYVGETPIEAEIYTMKLEDLPGQKGEMR